MAPDVSTAKPLLFATIGSIACYSYYLTKARLSVVSATGSSLLLFDFLEVNAVKALEDKILKEGKVYDGGILKVGSFLNQQIDSDFMMEMGKEIARLYESEKITKVLTVEASGIAVALAAGAALHVPVLFAKKHNTSNIQSDVYSSVVYSFTHQTNYNIVVSKDYLSSDDKVLIVDDFLARGKAIDGLADIVKQANAELVGCAVAIEKGFQKGGDELREKGIRVEALALIDSMEENNIVFRS